MTETRKTAIPKPADRDRAKPVPPHSPNDRKSAESVFRGVAGRPPEADFPDEAIAAAESARPDLPDENEDGLDELTAEVQRQAERGPVSVDGPLGIDGKDEDPDARDEETPR
jgi:hypothetical protein